MTPYYEADGITIYHGDCLDILPHLPKVDLALTDPPYDLNAIPPGRNTILRLGKYSSNEYKKLTSGFDIEHTFSLLPCALFNLFCFCSNKQLSSIMKWGESRDYYTTVLIWHKRNAPPFTNNVWKSDVEFCVHIRAMGAVFNNADATIKSKIYTSSNNNSAGQSFHPTQKPLELIKNYITIGSNENDFILDPFMGSGTTLVAAKQLGRKAIGIEIEEKYCEIAVKRLAQMELF